MNKKSNNSMWASLCRSWLGPYIDEDSFSTLEVGIWEGKVTLSDLAVKPNAISKLLPQTLLGQDVKLVTGTVSKCDIYVPWNALGSQAVRITLEGISIILEAESGISDYESPSLAFNNDYSFEDVARAEVLRKSSDSTFLQRLGWKIVDNIQVTVKNVHIQYREKRCNSGCSTVGLTLSEFVFCTTDSEGQDAKFVERTTRNDFLHKKCGLTSLAVYFDVNEDKNHHDYILQPCTVSCHVTKNESLQYTTDQPKWKVNSVIDSVKVVLTQEQYSKFMEIGNILTASHTMQQQVLKCRRPSPIYPISVEPLEWWRYAAASSRAKKFTSFRWSVIHRAVQDHREYFQFCLDYPERTLEHYLYTTSPPESVVPTSVHAKMCLFEKIFPLALVLSLRSKADRLLKTQETTSSWYSYLFGGESLVSEEGLENIEEASEYERLVLESEVPESCDIFQINLTLEKGVLHVLSLSDTPLLSATCDGSLKVHVRPSEWELAFELESFSVRNDIGKAWDFENHYPVLIESNEDFRFENICVAQIDEKALFIRVLCRDDDTIENDEISSLNSVVVKSSSFNIVADIPWLLALKSFLQEENHEALLWNYVADSFQEWFDATSTSLKDIVLMTEQQNSWDVSIELSAPVIMIPEDLQTCDSPVIFVDFGLFSLFTLKGSIDQAQSWKLSLNDVKVSMCQNSSIDRKTNALTDASIPVLHNFNMVLEARISNSLAIVGSLPKIQLSLTQVDLVNVGKILASASRKIEGSFNNSMPPLIKASQAIPNVSHDGQYDIRLCVEEIVLDISSDHSNDSKDILQIRLLEIQSSYVQSKSSDAKLQMSLSSFEIQDMLHEESSAFSKLVTTSGTSTKLILFTMDFFYGDSAEFETIISCDFESIYIQWNPSTIAVLYKMALAFFNTFSDLGFDKSIGQGVDSYKMATMESKWKLQARMQEFRISMNKDQLNRPLVTLSMSNGEIDIVGDETMIKVSGSIGDLTATDHLIPDSRYSQIVGLDSSKNNHGFLQFSYESSIKSTLTLNFSPIVAVYIHQQVLEYVDYMLEGVLGILLQEYMRSAASVMLQEDVGGIVFDVKIDNPTLVVPVNPHDESALFICASQLTLEHLPEGSVKRGESLVTADIKRIVLKSLDIRRDNVTSIMKSSVDVALDVEDILSLDIQNHAATTTTYDYYPRFSVLCRASEIYLLISHRVYLLLLRILKENLGADELLDINVSESQSEATFRPQVSYAYADKSLEAVTTSLVFSIPTTVVELLSQNNNVVRATTESFAKFTLNGFKLSILHLKQALPRIMLLADSFNVQDTKEIGIHPEFTVLGAALSPLEIVYEWDNNSAALKANLAIKLRDIQGVVIPHSILSILNFLMINVTETDEKINEIPVDTKQKVCNKNDDKNWDLALNIDALNLKLVFVQDWTTESSPKLVLMTDMNADISYCDFEYTICASAFGIQSYVTNDSLWNGCSGVVQLVDPTRVGLEARVITYSGEDSPKTTSLNGEGNVSITVDEIDIFLSYQDVLMLNRTLDALRKDFENSLVPQQSDSVEEKHEYYDLFGMSEEEEKSSSHGGDGGGRISLECKLESVQLTLINDILSSDLPLVQFQLQGGSYLFLNGRPTAFVAGGKLKFSALYYNIQRQQWEILFDPWELSPGIQSQLISPQYQISATATSPLNIGVSYDLLESLAASKAAWDTRHEQQNSFSEESSLSPFMVINETGGAIDIWKSGERHNIVESQRILNLQVVSVDFQHETKLGIGMARQYDAKRLVDVRINVFGGGVIKDIEFDKLGAQKFSLSDNTYVVCDTRLLYGRFQMSISSSTRVRNACSFTLKLLLNDPSWDSPLEIGVVLPQQEVCIPLKYATAAELRLQPISSHICNWSGPVPLKSTSQARSSDKSWYEVFAKSSHENFYFCISTLMKDSVLCTFEIFQPILVVNKLPLPLKYQVRTCKNGKVQKGECKSGEECYLKNCNTASGGSTTYEPWISFLVSESCNWTRWMRIQVPKDKVFSLPVECRGSQLSLTMKIVDPAETNGRLRLEIYAPVWLVNRTGMELVYRYDDNELNDGDSSNLTAWSGNARVSIGISQNKSLQLRTALGGNWSTKFIPDARRLDWNDECLVLKGNSGLYEFGVSSDYSTSRFENLTVIVGFCPRYVIINQCNATVYCREMDSNSKPHEVLSELPYPLYWKGCKRSTIGFSFEENCDTWSEALPTLDKEGTFDLNIPSNSSSSWIQVSVTKGDQSRCTFLVVLTAIDNSSNSIARSLSHTSRKIDYRVDISLKGISAKLKVQRDEDDYVSQPLSRLVVDRVRYEVDVRGAERSTNATLKSLVVEDLVSNRVVLRPFSLDDHHSFFVSLRLKERLDARCRWISEGKLVASDVKLSLSVVFLQALQKLASDITAYYSDDTNTNQNPVTSTLLIEDLLDSDSTIISAGSKIYIEHFTLGPVKARISVQRQAIGNVLNQNGAAGFWLRNLKLQIDDAALSLESYQIEKVLGTDSAIINSVTQRYYHAIKSQAFSLVDPIDIPSMAASLVTNAFSDSVSLIFNKIGGSVDNTLGLSSSISFEPSYGLSNADILRKHANLFRNVTSQDLFLKQTQHLLFDWDMNHQGVEAKVASAVGIINQSRNAIVISSASVTEGELVTCVPPEQKFLKAYTATNAEGWRVDRAVVIFSNGATPIPLLATGDVVYSCNSSAFKLRFDSSTTTGLQVDSCRGYTVAVVESQREKWWSRYLVIVSDDINEDDEEYEAVFHTSKLGLVAKQEGENRIVVKTYDCTSRLNTSSLGIGDRILSVNGKLVFNVQEFKRIVQRNTQRPIVLRLGRETPREDYNLFG